MFRCIVLTLALVLLPAPASAFNAMGHRTLAALAWHQLSAGERAKLDAILRAHPEAAKWEADRLKYSSTLKPAEYRFLRASDWPDTIKHKKSRWPAHSNWHFADYPLTSATAPVEPALDAGHNILAGLAESEETVRDAKASPEDRAVALSFVIHLMGDLHQPLHCATAITSAHPAPKGDWGGNDTMIHVKGEVKLHTFWDDLFGKSRDPDDAERVAIEVEQYGFKAAKLGDEQAWALASRALAQTTAYPPETWTAGKDEVIEVDPTYVKRAKALGEQQLVSGAARLVVVLRRTAL